MRKREQLQLQLLALLFDLRFTEDGCEKAPRLAELVYDESLYVPGL